MNVNVETLEKVKSSFMDCLNRWQIPHYEKGVNRILEKWNNSKAALRDKLRRSQYWDEEAQAIVYKIEEQRIVDVKAAENYAVELFTYVYQRVNDETATLMEDIRVGDTYFALSTNIGTFVTAPLAAQINECGFITVTEGEKCSRVWNKFYKTLGATSLTDKDPEHPENKDFKSYDKIFAKLADSLNPMKIERISLLSLHPNDYINMSNGTGWQSCHRAGTSSNATDRGGYFGGSMSYMLDEVTAILYTIDKKFDGTNYSMEPKIKRQVVCFGEDWFMTSRLYPSSFDGKDSEYEPYRNFVQQVYSECLDIPNLWVIKKSAHEYNNECFTTTKNSAHYPDYIYSGNNVVISYPKDKKINNLNVITIGSALICPHCGMEHNRKNNIYCDNCGGEGHYCFECGSHIPTHDITTAELQDNNRFICSDCLLICADCGQVISASSKIIFVEGKGLVCADCTDKYKWDPVAQVYYEGESFFLEDIGTYVSQKSIDLGLVVKCSECQLYFLKDNVKDTGKCLICDNTEQVSQSA